MSPAIADAEPAPPPLSVTERRWSLAAAISCLTVFAAGISLTAPLLSLPLEARGTDATLTGLNAGSAFLGVVLGPLITPRLVREFGLRRFVLACLAFDAALFCLLKVFDSISLWFVIRIALGIVGAGIFTATEAWISAIAGDPGRGRILGFYAASLSIGLGIGPLLLAVTGIDAWAPFIANALIAAAAATPLICLRDLAPNLDRRPGISPLAIFVKAPVIVLAVGVFGVFLTLEATEIILFIGNFAGNANTVKIGGYVGVVTAAVAWYASAAGVCNGMRGKPFLWVGQPFWKPAS